MMKIGIGIGSIYSLISRGVIDAGSPSPKPQLSYNIVPNTEPIVLESGLIEVTGESTINLNNGDSPHNMPVIYGFASFNGSDTWLRVPNNSSINGDSLSSGFTTVISFTPELLSLVSSLFWKDGEYECYVDASNKLIFKVYDAEGDWVKAEIDAPLTTPNTWISVVCVFTGSTVALYTYQDGVYDDSYTVTTSGVFGTLTDAGNDLYMGYNGTDWFEGGLMGFGIISEDFSSFGTTSQTILLDNLLFCMIYYNGELSMWETIYNEVTGSMPTTTQLWCPLISDYQDQTGNNTVGL